MRGRLRNAEIEGSNKPFRKRLKPKMKLPATKNEKPPAGFSTSLQPLKKVASKKLKLKRESLPRHFISPPIY